MPLPAAGMQGRGCQSGSQGHTPLSDLATNTVRAPTLLWDSAKPLSPLKTQCLSSVGGRGEAGQAGRELGLSQDGPSHHVSSTDT